MNHLCRLPVLLCCFLLGTAAFPVRAEKLHCPNVTDNDEKNTEVARKYFQMGGMYHDRQDYTKAAESFECVLKFIPYSLSARYKLAQAHDAQGVYTRARESYEMILLLDSAEAETLKAGIRKRLAELKDLKDRVQPVAVVPDETPAPDEKTCPTVVQKGQQDATVKVAALLEAKDWVRARTQVDEVLRKLDGATPEQRRLCLSTEAGVTLRLQAGVAQFQLGNLHDAREAFLAVFRTRPDANLPVKEPDPKLVAFFQETLRTFLEKLAAEKGLAAGKPTKKPVEKPVDKPVGKPAPPRGPSRPSGPRFFLGLSLGHEFGFISQGVETELGAVTDDAGWGQNSGFPTLELGWFFGRHRVSLLARLDITNYLEVVGPSDIRTRSGDSLNVALRWARFFDPVLSRIRPYAGAGLFGAPTRHAVATAGRGGLTGVLLQAEMEDSVSTKGLHLDAIAGAQVCLHAGCHVALQVELNWLWNVWNPDSPGASDNLNHFAFWLSFGLAVMF